MFDRVIVADWSAANLPTSATRRSNAIWIGCHDATGGVERHHRTRAAAEAELASLIAAALAAGERLLLGVDFALGYPAGFAERLTGRRDARAVWRYLAGRIRDGADNRNNRFAVAAAINAAFPEGPGPFWSHPIGQSWPGLPAVRAGIDYARLGLAERRTTDVIAGAKSPWMLFNPGSVGSQSLVALPMVHRLVERFGAAVWPFDPPDAAVVVVEVYPSLLSPQVAVLANAERVPADQAQVRLLSRALYRLAAQDRLDPLFTAPALAAEEGWILGADHAAQVAGAV